MSVWKEATGEEKRYIVVIILAAFLLLYLLNFIFPFVREDKTLRAKQEVERATLRERCRGAFARGNDVPLECYAYYR